MRELLAACVELDTLAVDAYALLAKTTGDAELAAVFAQLESDERQHLAWWADVQHRLDEGATFAVSPGVHVTAYMKAIVATIRSLLTAEQRDLSDDEMLSLASSLEFFALDPVFAELIMASHPQEGRSRLAAYDGHIERLLRAMESRRSWMLAPHIAMLRASAGVVDEPSTAELHDHVTGLPRRSVAEQAIAELCDDNARAKEPISVALMDLSLAALYARDEVAAERELLRMVSVMTSLLRFTDLLARIDTHRFMVVMPATAQSVAAATVSAVAHAVSSIATAACEGRESDWVTSAVVTVMPDRWCAGESVFSSAEALLEETRAAGEAFGARELD